MDCPFTDNAHPARDNAAAHAIASLILVLQRAVDGELAFSRGGPTPNGGVLRVVARMAPGRVQQRPADLSVGQLFPTLPGRAGEVGQGMKLLDAFGRFIEFAVAVLPDRRLGSLVRFARRRCHETKREPEFVTVRFALGSVFVESADSVFGEGG